MPICTLHLLSLNAPLRQFLAALSQSDLKPLTVARVVRWIVLPTKTSTDALLASNTRWDVLVVVPDAALALPAALQRLVARAWAVRAGVPSRLVDGFARRNHELLHPPPGAVPALTGALGDGARAAAAAAPSSAQALELSASLRDWIERFARAEGRGAVSMLNLLAFKPGRKAEYLKYGAAFAESVGRRRGGVAKLVGSVVADDDGGGGGSGGKEWDEIALAHYPSIMHFADMLASRDYQEVNQKHRVGSLEDTFILCTTELDLPWDGDGASSKL